MSDDEKEVEQKTLESSQDSQFSQLLSQELFLNKRPEKETDSDQFENYDTKKRISIKEVFFNSFDTAESQSYHDISSEKENYSGSQTSYNTQELIEKLNDFNKNLEQQEVDDYDNKGVEQFSSMDTESISQIDNYMADDFLLFTFIEDVTYYYRIFLNGKTRVIKCDYTKTEYDDRNDFLSHLNGEESVYFIIKSNQIPDNVSSGTFKLCQPFHCFVSENKNFIIAPRLIYCK